MSISKEDILESISNMSAIDICDLVKLMEEKFGISATAPVSFAPNTSDCNEKKEEEKTEFTVLMRAFGSKKINVIKTIRAITGLGLKEAKDMVEKSPVHVKENVSKEEAETIKNKLEEVGAEVELH